MTYSLEFVESALKEWRKLSPDIREQLKKKLAERLERPRVPADRLLGMPDCYKIKLRASGYRLVYEVQDKVLLPARRVGPAPARAIGSWFSLTLECGEIVPGTFVLSNRLRPLCCSQLR
ncbi:type II toxin-antitoxin system RelE/ParE family toxin [Fulvimonas yonginensis]|uniref:type II toxin-antitoxin system RelE family toxin n=1 Tax=Fulvimonas yonginensis TaxID=1495200 RepID=UPI0031F2EAFC